MTQCLPVWLLELRRRGADLDSNLLIWGLILEPHQASGGLLSPSRERETETGRQRG